MEVQEKFELEFREKEQKVFSNEMRFEQEGF
jgi:hypothetical protein